MGAWQWSTKFVHWPSGVSGSTLGQHVCLIERGDRRGRRPAERAHPAENGQHVPSHDVIRGRREHQRAFGQRFREEVLDVATRAVPASANTVAAGDRVRSHELLRDGREQVCGLVHLSGPEQADPSQMLDRR